MSKEMVISANPHETRVAIMEEGQLCEYYVERDKEFALVGSIYKGRVTRVLPGMQSSFVEIGLDSDAFLYVTDFLEGLEDLEDHVAAPAAHTVPKLSDGTQSPSASSSVDGGAIPVFETAAEAEFASDTTHAAHEGPDVQNGFGTEPLGTAEMQPARPMNPPAPIRNAGPGPDRDRFENRNRQGGRDFSRRGGNRSGRFGRRGGGGSGGGRSGGGRGPDQRFGRELPSSKYASSRPYEGGAEDSAAPEGHGSIILPGESLAKYRDKPPAEMVAPKSPDETVFGASADTVVSDTGTSDIAAEITLEPSTIPPERMDPAAFSPVETQEPIQDAAPRPSFKPEYRETARAEYPRASSSGIEPLPGESLSKWKSREPVK